MKHSLPIADSERPVSTDHTPVFLPAWLERWRWQLVYLLLTALLLLGSRAHATTIYTVGVAPTANYPTIGAAVAALPSPLTQAYELRLLDATYTEDVLLTKTGTATNTLTIRPAAGVSSVITGTLTFGAGCRFALLNGNNGSTARALTLRQPSAALPAVLFTGDASDNEVREAKVLGANALLTSGVIVVGDGVSTGNDRNAVIQSWVGEASPLQLPANLVYAVNAGGGANDGFRLVGSELFNFTRTGVLVGAGNGNQWTISNNSLYYNAAVPTTAQTGISFRPGAGANDATLSGNFVGGQAAGATGGTWTNVGTQDFRGIVLDCGTSATLTNEVTNNTVNEVRLTSLAGQVVTTLEVAAGRAELTGNAVTNVLNAGTSGVNSLVSRATTILSAFAVSNGQVMVVESGQTLVLGNLVNAGILNHTGGDLIINGSFTNTVGSAFAQTAGDLEVKGDMLNSGLFTCSTGKVKLTGAGPQQVSGGTYFNLEVSGGGTKTLTDNADVYNGVQMLNGILATDLYRLELKVGATLSETDASYVLGEVDARRVPSLGVAEDFGNLGLVLQPALASVLPGATLVKRFTGTAPTGAGGRTGIKRYFDIGAPLNVGLNVTMTLSYLPHELNGIAPADLRFFKSVNNGVTWENKGRSAAGPGYAVLNNVTGFSRWTLGDNTRPLPVGLTAFRAERQGRTAVLTWATATEQDNHGFGIEASADGQSYREIGFVAGSGTSSSARAYRFVDAAPGAGPRYYRLRQDDRDGAAHYYGPQQLNFDAPEAALLAYPTRFGPELTVALAHPTATTATLRLLDHLGREVWRHEQPLNPGAAPLRVQPTCAAGSYLLTATVGSQVLRQRLERE